LVAGTAGMSLASVIRLEFAYPGVGILAGDSLQYLSIATAHGVIMVFFMIMPVVFGAFGNFLLPTQLGVHDVAFPRLNSAAFWFLPGGLIMLMQLVCVDRRYQRMNCFNIRELQGVLKRKFFTDLINTNDHRDFLNQSIIGLRFKSNNQLAITPDLESFFNLGLTNTPKTKTNIFNNVYNTSLALPTLPSTFINTSYISSLFNLLVTNIFNLITSLHFNSLLSLPNSISTLKSFISVNTSLNLSTYTLPIMSTNHSLGGDQTNTNLTYSTDNLNSLTSNDATNTLFSETSNNVRFTRFSNPLISYDYKCGHYLGS
jgi:hypothetical protein